MKKHFICILILLITFTTTNMAESYAQTDISYQISFPEAQAHYVDVEMTLKGINERFIEVRMPVWAPGSYLIREFPKNVEAFSVKDDLNNPISSYKTNKNTWHVETNGAKSIKIAYRVYAFEVSVRTSFVDASHAFLSSSGIFMYPDGKLSSPSVITIHPHKNWTKISTGLEPLMGKKNTFFSPDFDILYDTPFEIGNQDTFEFEAAGARHEVAMYGGGNYDKEVLSRDMAKIVETETDIFNENPNKRYVFIIHNSLNGGGGLEHLNSTVLGAIRLGYAGEKSYKSFLSLVAHEYFHIWNVKRLRPKALGPFDYSSENYTSDLWISEGFTAYYDNLILRRADIYSPENYLTELTNDINTVENQAGNRIQPVTEASFDAWIKAYRPNENSKNSTISYYNKGALIGMILDLEILNATNGARRLDDVLKAMYDEYYTKLNRGFTSDEFKEMAEKVATKPLDEIYSKYINCTESIDFDKYLGYAGLCLIDDNAGKQTPSLGVSTVVKDGKVIITSVIRGSAAWTDGLNVNDELIAINGNRIFGNADAAGLTDLSKFVSSKKAGENVAVLLARDGLIHTINLTITNLDTARYRIAVDDDARLQQVKIRDLWLAL